MFYYLCLALMCGLTTAQVTTCPDGKTSCGEGQTCCFSNGRFTCCDLVDDPRIVAGSPSLPYLNSTLSGAPSSDVSYAPDPIWDYCPKIIGKKICCDPYRVTCLSGSDCCFNGKCCFRGTRCCGNGEWCCTKPLKCGAYHMTCYSGAKGIYPLVGLILAAVVSLLFNGKAHFLL